MCIFVVFLIFSYLVEVDVYLMYKTPNKQKCLSVHLSGGMNISGVIQWLCYLNWTIVSNNFVLTLPS